MAYPYNFTDNPLFDTLKARWDTNELNYKNFKEVLTEEANKLSAIVRADVIEKRSKLTWAYSFDHNISARFAGFCIIRKVCTTPPAGLVRLSKDDYKDQWSKPFKIAKGMMFIHENSFDHLSWTNKALRNGMELTEAQINEIELGIVPDEWKW